MSNENATVIFLEYEMGDVTCRNGQVKVTLGRAKPRDLLQLVLCNERAANTAIPVLHRGGVGNFWCNQKLVSRYGNQ